MNEILIEGQIYIITNIITQKQYVGQSLSHRKNHNRYIPFGFEGRFRDHTSEALCNTKRKQCWYLNNAIRKHGKDSFEVRLLETCPVNEMDIREQKYIAEYNTLYPNGYNLTKGGKTTESVPHEFTEGVNPSGTRGGCLFRSEETRIRISERLSDVLNTEETRKKRSGAAKIQHMQQKLEKMKDVQIDPTKLHQYITSRKDRVVVRIGNRRVDFTSKEESLDAMKDRALEFLQILATLPNCSGNP